MCMSPNMMLRKKNVDGSTTWAFISQKEWNKSYLNRDDVVPVACGKCPACKQKWRTQLAQRARFELISNGYHNCFFATFTVSDKYIDKVFPNGELTHRPFQLFMKKLRNRLPGVKIKYLMCGEYGALNGRPHYHAVFYGWKPEDLKQFKTRSKKGFKTFKSALVEECWSSNLNDVVGEKGVYETLGFVDIGEVNEHTAPYMAKYLVKFAEINEEEFGKKKPYLVYPRDLLGGEWFRENYSEILRRGYFNCSNGTKVGIPRSFIECAKKHECMREDLEYYLAYREHTIEIKNFELMQEQGLKHSGELFFYLRQKGLEERLSYEKKCLNFDRKMVI